jgi:hypothetical protein
MYAITLFREDRGYTITLSEDQPRIGERFRHRNLIWTVEAVTVTIMTECGKRSDDYDQGTYRVNGHYHYVNGACDDEPPYEMGGPA